MVMVDPNASYHCYADDTQLIFSFPPSDTTASARISACLADISSWMTAHQLKLNPSKTELLIIPGDPSPAQDLAISLSNSMISPTACARNLGVTMDNQLSFSSHVTNVTRSCRFLLYNIRRIRPFLSTQATQVLVQSLVISRLDYCNSLLAGLPLNAIRPLQMIQNAAARLVFNLPKFSHTTPLLRSLHWLPVAARIRFKTLMLAYKAKNGPAPSYLKALVTSHNAPRLLRSTSTARLVPPSLREKGSSPAKKVMLSNVPPFISDEAIGKELSRYGRMVSPIKKIPLGCKSPLVKHLVSFRRMVFMVFKEGVGELNVVFKFTVDGFDYNIFVSSDTDIKCFKCGQTGHLARACPKSQSDPGVSEQLGQDTAEPAGVVPPAAAVWPAAEGPGAAAVPDLTESEPQAQPAAQKPTGATPAPEKPRTAEPAVAEPRSARPDRRKSWSTEKSSVGSGAVLEPPALTEAGTEYTLNVTRDIVRSLKALEIEIVELQRLDATGNRGHIEALKNLGHW
ncbi:hypothetical protein QTP86_024129 [Hemibagrus guttatus]|nr:hypothetical protein QTP86_024129 [Hemibagrus guttatus]